KMIDVEGLLDAVENLGTIGKKEINLHYFQLELPINKLMIIFFLNLRIVFLDNNQEFLLPIYGTEILFYFQVFQKHEL
ncbi:hypothetical protein ACJX0J_012664, partial [Zea mays]